MENGLLLYPMGGTIDGRHGDHILLAPPFICTAADISRIVELVSRTIFEVLPYTYAMEPVALSA